MPGQRFGRGRGAGTIINDTSAHANADPGWVAITALENTVATFVSSTLTENGVASFSTTHTSQTVNSGVTIEGVFTSITLVSGSVVAYSE